MFTMLDYLFWKRMPSGKEFSPSLDEKLYFERYYDKELIKRAAYFKEMVSYIAYLGIYNPNEIGSLIIEPFHPYASKQIPKILSEFGYTQELSSRFISAGLSILSVPLLLSYNPVLIFDLEEKDYLFDPFYGIIFWREGIRIRNTCLVIQNLAERIKKYPQFAFDLLRNPVQILYEGVQMGHFLFQDKLSKFVKSAYDIDKVPEIQVRTEDKFISLIENLQELSKKDPKVELWLRGQPHDYLMPERGDLAIKGIVPYSNYRDSSLVPSLYRDIQAVPNPT